MGMVERGIETRRVAHYLLNEVGLKKGDRICIYM